MPTGHAKATVGDTIVAETDTWEEVEGNVYFPPSSVKTEYLSKTDLSTHCPWKGDASYYTIKTADGEYPLVYDRARWGPGLMGTCDVGQELQNAAWYYPAPLEKAKHIRDHVAFCESKDYHYWLLHVHDR